MIGAPRRALRRRASAIRRSARLVSAEFVRKAAAWATAARPTASIKHTKEQRVCVIRPPATFDRNSTSVTGRRTSPGPVAADDHVSQMGVRAAFSQSRPIRTPPGAVVGSQQRVSTAWRLVSGPDRCATQTGIERLHRHRCLSVRMHRRGVCSTASIEQAPARPRFACRGKPAQGRVLTRIQLIDAPTITMSSHESAETHCRFGLDPAACDDPFEARETVALPGASDSSLRRV